MSGKRQRSRKRENNKVQIQKILYIIGLTILFLLLGLVNVILTKDYYKIESRIDRVKNTKIDNGSDFETIGWLRVQGTNMDMPIVYSESRSDNFPVQLGGFVWSLNYDKKFHNNIKITGHNIFNLSSKPKIHSKEFQRFEELMSFVYYDFSKKNEYVQLTLDGKEYLYKIFSVGFIPETVIANLPIEDDYSKTNMKDYLEKIQKYNIYDYDIDVNEKDSIISLSTCTRFYGLDNNVEFFVNGRLLREGEKANKYNVKKNKRYKKIEKILKGDDKNEEDSL